MEAPARRFLFLGGYRLDELYGQRASWAKRKGREVRALSFSFLTVGAGLQLAEPDARVQLYQEIEYIREYLEESQKLAVLDDQDELSARAYFYGRLPMFSVPFDKVKPATLYMVGETERTFVALGGQLKDVVNRDPEYAAAAEGAPLVKDEPEVVAAVARAMLDDDASAARHIEATPRRWEQDVVATHQRFTYYPELFRKKSYEILAYKDEFTRAEELAGLVPDAKNVLLGKPLFVADA